MKLYGQWRLALKILPVVLAVIVLKIIFHALNFEILTLSPLFSGVIGATVFLLGFMIAGTLTDYKESERLPSDLAASLHSIADECDIVASGKGKRTALICRQNLEEITDSTLSWLRKKASSDVIFDSIEKLNKSFAQLAPFTETTFLNRIKTEQNQIRRMALRMHTIQETSFVGTGYAIAELATFMLILGLLLAKRLPYFEALFFIGIITFILIYMIALITDLDNPFDYSDESEGSEISLKPLEQLKGRLRS